MPVDYDGRQYTTVKERLLQLNQDTNKNYSINTEIIEHTGTLWVVKATLTIKDRGVFTGHNHQVTGGSTINKTSALEKAETYAIGRALSSAGYGGNEFCSADELADALRQQNKLENIKITKEQIQMINELLKELGLEGYKSAWLKKNNIIKLEDCSIKTANEAIQNLLKIQKNVNSKNTME